MGERRAPSAVSVDLPRLAGLQQHSMFALPFVVASQAVSPYCSSSQTETKASSSRRITVSGQSAGASIAIQREEHITYNMHEAQFHLPSFLTALVPTCCADLFAFSGSVDGAAIAAGSPFGCGAQNLHGWKCYYGWLDIDSSVRYVHRRHQQRLIDDPANLKDIPVHLFSGKLDFVVLTGVMRSVQLQLERFVNPKRISASYNTSASHVWSVDHGTDCDVSDGRALQKPAHHTPPTHHKHAAPSYKRT